mgnify:CR=1 FL=1
MLTPEDVQLLSELLDKKLKPIDERLDSVEERLDTIEENTEITRTVLNEVVKWIDFYFRNEYPFPVNVDKKAM